MGKDLSKDNDKYTKATSIGAVLVSSFLIFNRSFSCGFYSTIYEGIFISKHDACNSQNITSYTDPKNFKHYFISDKIYYFSIDFLG